MVPGGYDNDIACDMCDQAINVTLCVNSDSNYNSDKLGLTLGQLIQMFIIFDAESRNVQEYRASFNSYDRDNDGFVSQDDIRHYAGVVNVYFDDYDMDELKKSIVQYLVSKLVKLLMNVLKMEMKCYHLMNFTKGYV